MSLVGSFGAAGKFKIIPSLREAAHSAVGLMPEEYLSLGRWCMKDGSYAHVLLDRGLFDTNGDRHAEIGHPIENRASDFCLRLLIGRSPGVKAPSNDDLIAKHRRFNQASSAIARASLPLNSPVTFDRSEMRIA